MFHAGSNRGISMSNAHVTYLKTGGYISIHTLTREEEMGRVEHNLFFGKDIDREPLYPQPGEYKTYYKYHAPSGTLKERFKIWLWNLRYSNV